jgi:hypothetical protein
MIVIYVGVFYMLLSHTIVSYKFQNTVCHTYIHCVLRVNVESVIFLFYALLRKNAKNIKKYLNCSKYFEKSKSFCLFGIYGSGSIRETLIETVL